MINWWGDACTSPTNMTTLNKNSASHMTQEDAMSYYNNVHCPAGMVLNGFLPNPNAFNNFQCGNINQTALSGTSDTEAIRGIKFTCPTGQVVRNSWGGMASSVSPMYTDIGSKNPHFECRECVDNLICR